ncbi:hypothetical protein [Paramicrobacterium fandaimingii]|uniref:hypothetical protein n=1 Tax=Paramicrobacterium fandaimingii TaxID=2708079 RepID=UPI0014200EAC|nr:hypothetical protein [Microbacterium fandaimingii]
MTQSSRSATSPALAGIALALVTIVVAVIVVVVDFPMLAKIGLGVLGGLALICAGACIGYALAIIRVRDDDDDES